MKELEFEFLIPGHGPIQRGSAYLDLLNESADSIADQRDSLLAGDLSVEEVEAQLEFTEFRERYTGGNDVLANRFDVWFEGPFRKAALEALKGEPMVVIEPSAEMKE